jgi:hypothetical protein
MLSSSQSASRAFPFCTGAAGVTTLWCFFHGRTGLGFVFLFVGAALVPLGTQGGLAGWVIAELLAWTASLWMGCCGTRMAWVRSECLSFEELRSRERPWNCLGAVMLAFRVCATLLAAASVL